MTSDANGNSSLAELVEKALCAYESGKSTADFEPEFVRLVEYVRCYPAYLSELESIFLNWLLTCVPSPELLEFCMHALRLPKVEAELRSLLENDPHPVKTLRLQHVLDATDDSWNDAEMYEYFRRS